MSAVTNAARPRAASLMAVACVVACGSQGGHFGQSHDDLGIVGSGPGGHAGNRDGQGHVDGGGDDGADGGRGERDGAVPEAGNSFDGSEEGESGVMSDAGIDATTHDGGGGGDSGGSNVGVTFNEPPGFFTSLTWVISGPNGYYSGIVYLGDAHSVEFVIGGIRSGDGYMLTMAGNDRYGDPCDGTSAPFDVVPGQVAGAGVVITCRLPASDASLPADVTNGSVGVDASVLFADQ